MNKPCTKCQYSIHHSTLKKDYYTPNKGDIHCENCRKYEIYKDFLESKRKYMRGEKIHSLSELDSELNSVGFVFIRNKLYHVGWLCSWPYRSIKQAISSGDVYKAVRKDSLSNE